LDLDPETVVQRLKRSSDEFFFGEESADVVENGAIVSRVVNFDLLPLTVFEWTEGLMIRDISFKGKPEVSPRIAFRLSFLNRLSCGSLNLTELDLSNVPGLTTLYCQKNQLTELDIRPRKNLADFRFDPSVTIQKRRKQSRLDA